MILGYGLAAFTKPIFPLAQTIGWVFTARFVDRIGKGIRGAPRDALIADITPLPMRCAAYGLRQALDSVGALLGPLLAVVFMMLFLNDIRTVMWMAVIPAYIAVALLTFYVREPEASHAPEHARAPLTFADARRLPLRYWLVVLLGAVFTLARFSEAFLVLRAQDIGLALGFVPVVMVVMNIFYAGGGTLPGNVALAVGRDLDYVRVRQAVDGREERYYLAKERLPQLTGGYAVEAEMPGRDLVGRAYRPLFDFLDLAAATGKKAYYVCEADFVTTGDGTGVVHTAVVYARTTTSSASSSTCRRCTRWTRRGGSPPR